MSHNKPDYVKEVVLENNTLYTIFLLYRYHIYTHTTIIILLCTHCTYIKTNNNVFYFCKCKLSFFINHHRPEKKKNLGI